MTSIGERIIFLREEQNMSQKELASKLHITAATLSRYENNIHEPKAVFLQEMCSVLNTTSDFLLGLSNSYQKENDPNRIKPTTTELQLIKNYRKLSSENQLRVMERTETLAELQSN